MTKAVSSKLAIPEGCKEVKAHSKFGSQTGYVHYVHPEERKRGVYYIGLELNESHSGAPGRGHGAVTMAILDEVMGRAASRNSKKLCYTASMTTNFCAGSKIGDFLLGKATVARTGKSLVFVDAQLFSGDRLIATATGTFVNSGHEIPFTKAEQGD